MTQDFRTSHGRDRDAAGSLLKRRSLAGAAFCPWLGRSIWLGQTVVNSRKSGLLSR